MKSHVTDAYSKPRSSGERSTKKAAPFNIRKLIGTNAPKLDLQPQLNIIIVIPVLYAAQCFERPRRDIKCHHTSFCWNSGSKRRRFSIRRNRIWPSLQELLSISNPYVRWASIRGRVASGTPLWWSRWNHEGHLVGILQREQITYYDGPRRQSWRRWNRVTNRLNSVTSILPLQ